MSGAVRELEPPTTERASREPPPPPSAVRWFVVLGGGALAVIVLGFVAVREPVPPPTFPVDQSLAEVVDPVSHSVSVPEWPGGSPSWTVPALSWKQWALTLAPAEIAAVSWNENAPAAVGWDADGPAIWRSSTGAFWARHSVTGLISGSSAEDGMLDGDLEEEPPQERDRIRFDAITAVPEGHLILGALDGTPTAWRVSRLYEAESVDLRFAVEEPGAVFRDLASDGSRHLALVDGAGTSSLLISNDESHWLRIASPVFEGSVIGAVDLVSGRFVAMGSDCRSGSCVPGVWWSDDGALWEPSFFEAAAGHQSVGEVAATDAGWIAAGVVGGSEDSPTTASARIRMWTSFDGVVWSVAPDQGDLFSAAALDLVLVEIRHEPAGHRAVLAIGTQTVEVGRGDEIADVFRVERVTERSIELSTGVTLTVGERRAIPGEVTLLGLAAKGRRVVAVGEVAPPIGDGAVAVVWASVDGGVTWEGAALPGTAEIIDIATFRARPTVLTSTPQGTATSWMGAWDMTAEEYAATSVVRRLLTPVQQGDLGAFLAAVPGTLPPPLTTPTSLWPTPAAMNLVELYGPESAGAYGLQQERARAVMEYTAALHGDLEVNGCTAEISRLDENVATVTCEASYSDDLLSLLFEEKLAYSLSARVESGRIVELHPTTDANPWGAFAEWLLQQRPTVAKETLIYQFHDDGEAVAVLPAGAEAADAHVAAARALTSLWLPIGETRVTDTALGLVEWSWASLPNVSPDGFGQIEWDGNRLVLTNRERGEQWTSSDGRAWEPVDVEFESDQVPAIGVSPLGPLSIDRDSGSSRTRLTYTRADGTPQDVPFSPSLELDSGAPFLWISDVAADETHVFVTTVLATWDEQETESWRWDPSTGSLVPIDVPWPTDECCGADFEILADGMVAFVNQWTDGGSAWHSIDGVQWRETLSVSDVGVSMFHQAVVSGNAIVMIGETEERTCRFRAVHGGERCSAEAVVFVSEDGEAWTRAAPAGGVLVDTFSELRAGPAGYVAWGWDEVGFGTTLWLSGDAAEWSSLLVQRPWSIASQGEQVTEVAVGDDTILVMMFLESPQAAEGFHEPALLVGRLVGEE